eukprot:1196393-Prorocentrum_minimum.AAC.2
MNFTVASEATPSFGWNPTGVQCGTVHSNAYGHGNEYGHSHGHDRFNKPEYLLDEAVLDHLLAHADVEREVEQQSQHRVLQHVVGHRHEHRQPVGKGVRRGSEGGPKGVRRGSEGGQEGVRRGSEGGQEGVRRAFKGGQRLQTCGSECGLQDTQGELLIRESCDLL